MSDYQPRQGGGYGQTGYGSGYGPSSHEQATYGQRPGTSPRRRRRRQPLVWLTVVVVLILAIGGIGDQVGKAYAQNRIAQQIQTSAQLSAQPSVNIEGWPFLTQVLGHDLKAIDFSANNITTANGKLPVSVTAKATGVRPDSSFSSATIDHINGQVTITYQALDSYLGNAIGIPGLEAIKFSPDPADGPNAITADAGIASVKAKVLKTSPNQIKVEFGSPGGIAALLGGAGTIPDPVIDIPKLPAGLVVGTPTATSQGVVIPASASNTTLSQ